MRIVKCISCEKLRKIFNDRNKTFRCCNIEQKIDDRLVYVLKREKRNVRIGKIVNEDNIELELI